MPEPEYERAAQLMEAELGDELVALDVQGGHCFGFNSVAASVWRLLDTPRTASDLKRSLLLEYDVDPALCESQLRDLLDDLVKRRLVRPRSGQA